MKFNFDKEARDVLIDLEHDEKFFQRSLQRVRIGQTAIKIGQMQKVGQLNKNMVNVDLEKGTFEVETIIVAKSLKDAVK